MQLSRRDAVVHTKEKNHFYPLLEENGYSWNFNTENIQSTAASTVAVGERHLSKINNAIAHQEYIRTDSQTIPNASCHKKLISKAKDMRVKAKNATSYTLKTAMVATTLN